MKANKKQELSPRNAVTAIIAAALILALGMCTTDTGSDDPNNGGGTEEKWTITFDPGEGASVDPASKEYSKGYFAVDLPVPVKPGCTFVDWYDANNGNTPDNSGWGKRVNEKTPVRKNMTVYARWVEDDPIPYPLHHVNRNTLKINKKGKPVINVMWGEPEEDPRIVMGYQLEDSGQIFFDRYVCLYGGRLVDWDCAGTGQNIFGDATSCRKTGLHMHIDDDVKGVMEQHLKYYKPLQDKGIKVLMGIVPQNGGVAAGTLYEWPMEDVKPWGDIYPTAPMGPEYRFGPEAADKLAEETVSLLNEYQIDGVAYDEEYANVKNGPRPGTGSVYPNRDYNYYSGSSGSSAAAAWKRGGANLLRFAAKLKELKPDIIQESYEITYGAYLPESVTWEDSEGTHTHRMTDVIDFSYAVYYADYDGSPGSYSPYPMPKYRYGPMAIDIGASLADYGGPRPKQDVIAKWSIDHFNDGFGVNMFYCLRSRDEMEGKDPRYGSRFVGFFGSGVSLPDGYLSAISQAIYGENVVYQGDDYARLW